MCGSGLRFYGELPSTLGVFLNCFLPYFVRQGLLVDRKHCLDHECGDPLLSASPVLGLYACVTKLNFSLECSNLNPGLLLCIKHFID